MNPIILLVTFTVRRSDLIYTIISEFHPLTCAAHDQSRSGCMRNPSVRASGKFSGVAFEDSARNARFGGKSW